MTTDEKISLLNSYDELTILSNEHLLCLQTFSSDADSFVRSQVAALLVNFINGKSKKLLVELAKDQDPFVRTEAYDSLAVFPFNDIEVLLNMAIRGENDDLARSYAILSWAEIVVSLNHSSPRNIEFLLEQKRNEKSARCLLSWFYAQYLLDDKSVLHELLSFLKNSNYEIRCTAISLLNEIVDEENIKIISASLTHLLKFEDNIAVIERASTLLESITNK